MNCAETSQIESRPAIKNIKYGSKNNLLLFGDESQSSLCKYFLMYTVGTEMVFFDIEILLVANYWIIKIGE